MRVWVTLLLVLASLSGCFGDSGEDDHDDGDDPDGGMDGNDGNETMNQTNAPPVAALGIFGPNGTSPGPNGTFENVTVPVNITFDIGLQDADGDDLQYTLDVTGDGVPETEGTAVADNTTYSPLNFTYGYTDPGVYNITLNVTDGDGNATVTAVLNLTAGQASVEQTVITGSASGGCPQCTEAGANTGAGYRAGQSGVDSYFTEIKPEWIGLPFLVESSGGDPDASFRDGCGGGGTGGAAVETHSNAGSESGVVPAGTNCILVWENGPSGADFTITIG